MQVIVTLDYYDGSKGKSIVVAAEDIPSRTLMFKMMESGVCGYTVTRLDTLGKLMERMAPEDG